MYNDFYTIHYLLFRDIKKHTYKYLAVLLSNGYLNRLRNDSLIDDMGELLEKLFYES